MTNVSKKKVAIFVSGSGTNMEHLARQVQAGKLNCTIALIVCDNPNAFALKRAQKLGLNTFLIERKDFKSKAEFDAKINEQLKQEHIDYIFLAGYMRILTSQFVNAWQWKILNIHPSLLPKYPGAQAIKDAFEAGEKETGVTIHFVDEGVDTGPVIMQRKVAISPQDTLETLEAKVHQVEYELYPEAIRLLLDGKVKMK